METKTKLMSYAQMQAAGFSGGKAVCPKCGQKTFVLYINEHNDTVTFFPSEFGVCDRQENCQYNEYPTDYFKNGDGARKASQTVNNVIQFTRPPAYVSRLPYDEVNKSLATPESECNFISYLNDIFDKDVTQFLIDKYKLGVDYYKDVIFYQIDANGEVRGGKTIPYRPDGKRKKKDKGETLFEIGWLHTKLKDKNGALLYPNYKLEQCLFGEHLLRENLDTPILIFESEKSAVVASVYAPFYFRNAICLATGGLELLNAAKLEVLRGRKITICPDGGETDKWNKKLKNSGLRYKIKEFSQSKGKDFVDTLEFEKGKALTLHDNLYYWPDGEVFDAFARNAIYLDFKHFNHHKNNEAPNVLQAAGLHLS